MMVGAVLVLLVVATIASQTLDSGVYRKERNPLGIVAPEPRAQGVQSRIVRSAGSAKKSDSAFISQHDFERYMTKYKPFADFSAIDVRYSNLKGSVTLHAARKIKYGELYMAYPEVGCLTSRDVAKVPVMADALQVLKNKREAGDTLELILYIMYLRSNPSDPNSIYTKWLPSKCGSLAYFSEEELATLDDPNLENYAFEIETELRTHYEKVMFELFGTPKVQSFWPRNVYNFDLFKWASICVTSRFFHASGAKEALVPIIEMVNHKGSEHCFNKDESFRIFEFDNKRNSMVFRANQDYHKGDELFICYNPHSNQDLLRFYGFAYPGNIYDRVTNGRIEIRSKEPATSVAARLIKGRCARASLQCIEELLTEIEGKLSSYRTPYDACTKALQDPTLTSNMRSALVYTQQQQLILRNAVSALQQMAAKFNLKQQG